MDDLYKNFNKLYEQKHPTTEYHTQFESENYDHIKQEVWKRFEKLYVNTNVKKQK